MAAEILTIDETANSFWAAHEKLRENMKKALAAAHASGYRGFVDVHFFPPFGRIGVGTKLFMSLVPVESASAALPFGWTRYAVTDSKDVKAVARGTANDA